MAYPIYKNHRVSTRDGFNAELFQWKEDMVTVGWRVLGSNNGTDFSNTGQGAGSGTGSGGAFDHFDTAADFDTATSGGNHLWLRLATPLDAPQAYEYLLYSSDTQAASQNANWRHEISRDGVGFDSAGSTAEPPTAADRVGLGMPNPASRDPGFETVGMHPNPSGEHRTFWILGDVESDYDWLFWTMREPNNINAMWGHLYVGVPSTVLVSETDPYVHMRFFAGLAGSNSVIGLIDSTNLSPDNVDPELPQESVTSSAAVSGAYSSYRHSEPSARFSGTYKIGCFVPCHQSGFSLFSGLDMNVDPVTGVNHSFNPVMWGKARGEVRFIKGFTKNETFRLATQTPQITNDASYKIVEGPGPDNDERLAFDGFSIPWRNGINFDEWEE